MEYGYLCNEPQRRNVLFYYDDDPNSPHIQAAIVHECTIFPSSAPNNLQSNTYKQSRNNLPLQFTRRSIWTMAYPASHTSVRSQTCQSHRREAQDGF